jgi:gas vesicle protein
MADTTKGDFLVGLLVGSALGAAMALLYAPHSGDETRDTIKRKGLEIKDSATDIYDQVKEQTTTIASQVKDSATNLASNVKDSATSVVSNAGATLSRTKGENEAGRQDLNETSSSDYDTTEDGH